MAGAGVAIAWSWYNGHEWLSFVVPAVVAGVAWAVSEFGVSRVRSKPVTAVRLMPWRIIVAGVVAAAAAGLVIIVTVELTLPEKTSTGTDTPTDLKEIVSALSTAITAFLAAAFIDWTGESDDSRVADWIRDTFYGKYKDVFKSNTDGEKYVFSNYVVEGWGAEARSKRAAGIAAALADPQQLER